MPTSNPPASLPHTQTQGQVTQLDQNLDSDSDSDSQNLEATGSPRDWSTGGPHNSNQQLEGHLHDLSSRG